MNSTTRPSTLGNKLYYNLHKLSGENGIIFISTIFFSSTNLMKMLLEQETHGCGTTRANRKKWPTEFRKPTVLKLKRGESSKMQHEDVTAVVWQDKCSMRM